MASLDQKTRKHSPHLDYAAVLELYLSVHPFPHL